MDRRDEEGSAAACCRSGSRQHAAADLAQAGQQAAPATEVSGSELPHSSAMEQEPASRIIRRIRKFSVVAWIAFAIWMLLTSGWWGFLGLTCSAAVVMINFLWLEEIVEHLLQPAPHLHAWKLTLRSLARFALLGVALVVTIFVARFNALSVLLGFSIVVVGIIGEALYMIYRSFAE